MVAAIRVLVLPATGKPATGFHLWTQVFSKWTRHHPPGVSFRIISRVPDFDPRITELDESCVPQIQDWRAIFFVKEHATREAAGPVRNGASVSATFGRSLEFDWAPTIVNDYGE